MSLVIMLVLKKLRAVQSSRLEPDRTGGIDSPLAARPKRFLTCFPPRANGSAILPERARLARNCSAGALEGRYSQLPGRKADFLSASGPMKRIGALYSPRRHYTRDNRTMFRSTFVRFLAVHVAGAGLALAQDPPP